MSATCAWIPRGVTSRAAANPAAGLISYNKAARPGRRVVSSHGSDQVSGFQSGEHLRPGRLGDADKAHHVTADSIAHV